MKNTKAKEYTIRGTILPDDWDKDGNITSIGIESNDEEEYIIDLNKCGMKLLSFIDCEVEVTGKVKNQYGELIFTVNNYKILRKDHI